MPRTRVDRSQEPDTPLRATERPPSLPATSATVSIPPGLLDFATTAELTVLASVIEQDRAQASLALGLGIDRPNYHVYVAGPSGTGKRSQVRALLDRVAPGRPVPPDIVYVHNFDEPEAPQAITLPAGMGVRLRKDVDALLTTLRDEVPKAFHGRTHQELMQRAVFEGNLKNTEAFGVLRRAAAERGFAVHASDEGEISMQPVVNGEPLDEQGVFGLDEPLRATLEQARADLEPVFTDFMQTSRGIERATHERMHELTLALARDIGRPALARLRRRYRPCGPRLKAYLSRLEEDFLGHLGRFLPEDEPQGEEDARERPDPFIAFRVKVVVDNSQTKGAPVVFENHPTFYRLFGKIERRVEQGIYFTDHSMIRAGSLLQANGGYLVCHAADLVALPGVWETLKSSLRNREVAIEDLGESAGLLPTSGLKPEPIPISVKLILIGGNTLYHTLYRLDDDFRKIFQVKADFDDEIRRTDDNLRMYARFIATAVANNDCLPLDREAVAAVITHASRLCESQRRLTLRFNSISNLLVEATWQARSAGKTLMDAGDIERALRARALRSSLIADKMHEDVEDGQVLLEAEGHRVGVVNGLAVLSVGEHEFGRPFRVTARTFAGNDGVVNIEHEADMSGELHDKGVQILVGLLGDRFARRSPLSLTATVTFEQSYGAVDGDSASSTWLFAIVSALAGVPVDQGVGVTGSINQLGEIQPVGGVNHKIEGFFRFCKARGLTGRQGVIFPAQNVQHLVLDAEVREAMAAGAFHLWPIQTIEEGLQILTGVEAGSADAHGDYPAGTIMARAAARLAGLREAAGGMSGRSGLARSWARAPRRGDAGGSAAGEHDDGDD